jgi:L-2-hydroxyglutarate oxidase LhgO
MRKIQYLIIGSGIIGLTIAHALKRRDASADILILDKEKEEASHASSRNSGVLHAGFYYTSDSLKAKFTVAGSKAMKEFCRTKNLPINACGKLVVAQNEEELKQLYELERRGKANGSNIEIIDEAQALKLEPNVRTYKKALYSPETASVDPKKVCQTLKQDLENRGVQFLFSTAYVSHANNENIATTSQGKIAYQKLINCAGLYADKIAHDFGFGKKYTIIPFKGIYLKYTKNKIDVKMNIYPVPDLRNPFLGVHFTKTVSNEIKIGPTAIPAFWRENYHGLTNFKIGELGQILFYEAGLFLLNTFNFRSLALEEMRKYKKEYFISLAQKMVQSIDPSGFTEYTAPGIRAQLYNTDTKKLLQDFVVEGDKNSIHVLNAVSPAFTCSFPFAQHVVQNYILI